MLDASLWAWFWGIASPPLACFLGLYLAYKRIRRQQQPLPEQVRDAGWIYFLSAVGGADDDPPSPIKIGRTSRDPARDRLPEIETMSPLPLEVIWSFHTINTKVVEHQIHEALKKYRMHGEWFERDPTMMYIDHLKGAS